MKGPTMTDIYLYVNSHVVNVAQAFEVFYQQARNKKTYNLEECRRIFDLALLSDHTKQFRDILREHYVEVLEVKSKAV